MAGVSGGATLGLALAAAGVPMAAALLHEPAVGSLLPGLLSPFRAAYLSGGTAAFAEALYGPAWTPGEAPADAAAVGLDLAMFAAFEPERPAPEAGPVVITVGECSPPVRHESVRRLGARFGLPVWAIPGARHAVHLEDPRGLGRRHPPARRVISGDLTQAPNGWRAPGERARARRPGGPARHPGPRARAG